MRTWQVSVSHPVCKMVHVAATDADAAEDAAIASLPRVDVVGDGWSSSREFEATTVGEGADLPDPAPESGIFDAVPWWSVRGLTVTADRAKAQVRIDDGFATHHLTAAEAARLAGCLAAASAQVTP